MHLVRTEVPSYTKGWQDLAGRGRGIEAKLCRCGKRTYGLPCGPPGPGQTHLSFQAQAGVERHVLLGVENHLDAAEGGHGVCGSGWALPVQGGREAGLVGTMREVDRDALPETEQ